MSLRLATAAVMAMAVISGPALACMGPTQLLADNFQTVDTAWTVPPWIVPGGMTPAVPILSISGGYANLTPMVGDFAVVDYEGGFYDSADACVDVLSPTVADPSQAAAGIIFGLSDLYGRTDAGFFYVFAVEEDGNAAILENQNGSWLTPVAWRAAPALKTGANATNTLRVTWNGTTAAAYINGQPFATFDIQPLKSTKFGLWSEGDPGTNPTAGATYQFTNVKLTNVPAP